MAGRMSSTRYVPFLMALVAGQTRKKRQQHPRSWIDSFAALAPRSQVGPPSGLVFPVQVDLATGFIFKADVAKAHRRIKVLPKEGKDQVTELSFERFMNKVGTYGMASAQLYWSRQAAALLRILYAVSPWVDWAYVFVDDFAWLLRAKNAPLFAVGVCLLLPSLEVPLSWKRNYWRKSTRGWVL